MATARARARAELESGILTSARTQLAEVGPAALSLRAVARDIGMVSSAVYRYVASRDDLLTALIVQCYGELGEAVETADADAADRRPRTRWMAACRAIRAWAAANPHEYALLYGSPVPGYRAPQATIEPATRPTFVLVRIVLDAHRDRSRSGSGPDGTLYAPARAALVELSGGEVTPDDALVRRTLMAWTTIFGLVSFERFGHLVGSVSDDGAFFDEAITALADDLGL